MPDYLVYWKGFWDDTGGDLRRVYQGWHTKNESLYKSVAPGDVLWVVVTAGPSAPTEWRLLQRIQVLRRDPARGTSSYGPYHLIPDKRYSKLFAIARQSDFAPTMKSIIFGSGKRIDAEGALIGRQIQTARKITPSSSATLDDSTESLPLAR